MATSLPVDSSWRMVEGEHDSFDTSIVANTFSLSGDDLGGTGAGGDDPFLSSSDPPSQQSLSPPARRRGGLGLRTTSSGSRLGAGVSSSQEDRVSVGGDSFISGSGGSVGGGSFAGSQDDDIHSFLRKAESDERVLLRSPFQPSLPSSVRQTPQGVSSASKTGTQSASRCATNVDRRFDRTSFKTPEPEFRMPTVEMDGSLLLEEDPAALRRRGAAFRVSGTGSPAQRWRMASGNLLDRLRGTSSGQGGSGSGSKVDASTAPATSREAIIPLPAAWKPALLLFLSLVLAYAAAVLTNGSIAEAAPKRLYSTAFRTVCSIPGIPRLGLLLSPPAENGNENTLALPIELGNTYVSRDENYWTVRNHFYGKAKEEPATESEAPASLVRCAGDLMRAQIQLASVVRRRVLPSRSGRTTTDVDHDAAIIPPAHDAWRVPRSRTKDLHLTALQQQQRQQESDTGATLFVIELEAYLEAMRRVSTALFRLQTGAASITADTLAYSTRRTLAQLRRMQTHFSKALEGVSSGNANERSKLGEGDGGSGGSWLARLFSSDGYTSARRRCELLAGAYRYHTDALLVKAKDRVCEAEAVLHALEVADKHLAVVQKYVAVRQDTNDSQEMIDSGPGVGGFVAWLIRLFGGRDTANSTASSSSSKSKEVREWATYAAQLDLLRSDHDAAVRRSVDALDELAGVRDVLDELQARLKSSTFTADEGDLDMRLHVDIVEAGIQDLEMIA